MTRPSILRRLTAASVAVASLTACGPRPQDAASPLRGVPYDLSAPTTTSTTSTTIASPPTTLVATEGVILYFVRGDAITSLVRSIRLNAEPGEVLDLLLEGYPSTIFGLDVRSAIPDDLKASVSVERGLATVDTDESLLSEISPIDQPLAIAQIVLTLTSRPGIGQVNFLVNGEPQAVPRGGGELAPADEPVAYDDYAMLLG